MEPSIHDNEHDFTWEDTLNVFSYEGYRILESIADAQTYLDEHYATLTESDWKKIGKIIWKGFNESLKPNPLFYHPKNMS